MMSPCELSATKLPRYLLASSFRARAVQSDAVTRIFFLSCLADDLEESNYPGETDEFSSAQEPQRGKK